MKLVRVTKKDNVTFNDVNEKLKEIESNFYAVGYDMKRLLNFTKTFTPEELKKISLRYKQIAKSVKKDIEENAFSLAKEIEQIAKEKEDFRKRNEME